MGEFHKIGHNFSRHADSYNTAAQCQAAAAAHLTDLIHMVCTENIHVVTDLGVGTGFLSRELFHHYPEAAINAVDIAPGMLEQCQRHPEFQKHLNDGTLKLILNDIRTFVPLQETELCVSGLTVQWLADIRQFLTHIRSHLKPGAIFAFSTLMEGTFQDLQSCFKTLGFPYPGPAFLSRQTLDEIVGSLFDICVSDTETRIEHYPSPRAFLRQVQQTGAVNAGGKPVSVPALRQVIQHYETCYQTHHGDIAVQYQLAYYVCRIPQNNAL